MAGQQRDGGRDGGGALLGDLAAREHDGGRLGGGRGRRDVSRIAAPEPAQADDVAAQPLVAQARFVQRAEHERPRGQRDAQPLHRVADAPAGATEVLLPVAARPDLEPVDRERHPRARQRRAGREEREERERAQMDRVVGAAVAQEVAQHAGAEAQRRADRAPAGLVVERVGARDGHHAHAGDPRLLARRPLHPGEVGDLVPLGHQPLGERAIPPLGAADRPREQAVVGDAEPHRGRA